MYIFLLGLLCISLGFYGLKRINFEFEEKDILWGLIIVLFFVIVVMFGYNLEK